MIDSHCHLSFERTPEQAAAAIDRAFQAGVTRILSVACREEELPPLIDLMQENAFIDGAFGIHPEYVTQGEVTIERLVKAHLSHPRLIAVGETGLDYCYSPETRSRQLAAFETHIQAAYQMKKPLIIHTRDAEEDTIAVLQAASAKGLLRYGAVLHCFTGSAELAAEAVRLGLYISASGIITFKRAESLRSVFKGIPLNRLLVETDAPYLAPEPYRGKVNEPAYVVETAKMLADLKGISVDDIARQTTANFQTLFLKREAV